MLDNFVVMLHTNPYGWVWVLGMFVVAGVLEGCVLFVADARSKGLL